MQTTPIVMCDNPDNAKNLSITNVQFTGEYNIGDILQMTSSLADDGYVLVVDKSINDSKVDYSFLTLIGGRFSVRDLSYPLLTLVA